MNLLLTSAGRRSYLVDYFKQAWGKTGKVHAGNNSRNSCALFHADYHVITPSIYSDEYIPFLFNYCTQNDIRVIVPLFDIDLPVLAKHSSEFAAKGIRVIVSKEKVLNICNDKWATYQFLESIGIKAPKTYVSFTKIKDALLNKELSWPVVIKPRWGMGSIGIYIAENADELRVFYARVLREIQKSYLRFESKQTPDSQVIFQEFIPGNEYGLDVVNNLDGKFITTLVKRKLAMRSGETDSAVTVENSKLFNIGKTISTTLGHIANLDVDVLERDGSFYVLELNARFGGGYPFSHLAGADLPLALLHWIQGQEAPAQILKIRPGITGIKAIQPEIVGPH